MYKTSSQGRHHFVLGQMVSKEEVVGFIPQYSVTYVDTKVYNNAWLLSAGFKAVSSLG